MSFQVTREQMLKAGNLIQSRVNKNLTAINDLLKSPSLDNSLNTKFRGTGCYFSFDGFPFVLTAKHVIDSKNVEHCIHITPDGKGFPFRGGWVSPEDIDADVAIYGCFQQILDTARVVPFSYSELMVPSFGHKNAFYFCNGFPETRKVDLPFMNQTTFNGNSFIGKQTTLPDGYDEKIHFAVDYPCKTEPLGMSGSPIWNLRFHCINKLEDWSPDVVSFAGVVHRWHKNTQKLIVTKVEFIRDFVPGGIMYLKAKYGWKDGNN